MVLSGRLVWLKVVIWQYLETFWGYNYWEAVLLLLVEARSEVEHPAKQNIILLAQNVNSAADKETILKVYHGNMVKKGKV